MKFKIFIFHAWKVVEFNNCQSWKVMKNLSYVW